MLEEFKKFAMRGNGVDLAVGVIIGAAFGAIVNSLVGDIVICPAVAARNAVDHDCSFDDEIALLVVHGVLHLLGWDHVVDDEAERMEARERELLARHYQPSGS